MASEIEAAERYGRFMAMQMGATEHADYCMGPMCTDRDALAQWAVARLAADRAEREDRTRPIDAEWCAANGGAIAHDGAMWSWFIAWLVVSWHVRDGVTLDDGDGNWTFLAVANRDDFGDLLRVLKGGAE